MTMTRRVGRAGFTLVETLITLIVAGVLGVAILTLILGQNRFYEHSDDAIYAQQTIRAAMDLMSSELRMISPTDLLAAEEDSLAARFDLVRGVVCDTLSSDDVYLFVYDSVENANLPAGFRGAAASGPYSATYVYGDNFDWRSETSTPSAAQSTCENNGSPVGVTPSNVYRQVSGLGDAFSTTALGGAKPERGSLVRFYGELSYSLGASSFGSGLAVWRNDQELVSPFETGGSFEYVMADGSVQSSVGSSDFDQVRVIRIDLTAVGEDVNRYGVERQIEYEIPLRN